MAKFDFRSDETQTKYKIYREQGGLENGCRLCEKETINDFVHWRTVANSFPYDRIAERHDLLVTKEHVTEDMISNAAKEELIALKKGRLNETYDFVLEALPGIRSIPTHHHLHLIVRKEVPD
jgi:hypothetical protein